MAPQGREMEIRERVGARGSCMTRAICDKRKKGRQRPLTTKIKIPGDIPELRDIREKESVKKLSLHASHPHTQTTLALPTKRSLTRIKMQNAHLMMMRGKKKRWIAWGRKAWSMLQGWNHKEYSIERELLQVSSSHTHCFPA